MAILSRILTKFRRADERSVTSKRFLHPVGVRRMGLSYGGITNDLPGALCRVSQMASSLSDLKEIGCKSAWPVHISPLFWSIERLLTCKTVKICPRPAEFSLRFFKSDRLLVVPSGASLFRPTNCGTVLNAARGNETKRTPQSGDGCIPTQSVGTINSFAQP